MSHSKESSQIIKQLRKLIDDAENSLSRSGRQSTADEQIRDLKNRLHQGFDRLRDSSSEKADRFKDEVGSRVRDYYEDLEDRLRTGTEITIENVRAHPYRTAFIVGGIALLGGFFLMRQLRD